MHLVSLIKKNFFLFFSLTGLVLTSAKAQDNSPTSRVAVGDIIPNKNMVSRSMGGVSVGYADYQSINFANPAAISFIPKTIFDIGGEVDIHRIISNVNTDKYKSVNSNLSYIQIGFPIASKKMVSKQTYWGVAAGLRPLSRISYDISERKRLPNIDSVLNNYTGNGGLSQFMVSTAIQHKGFSFGLSSGYTFGNKYTEATQIFINDSTGLFYSTANIQNKTSMGGIFLKAGVQYSIKVDSLKVLRLGAYYDFKTNLKANHTKIDRTVAYNASTENWETVDTLYYAPDTKGTVTLPSAFGLGFTYVTPNWVFGLDGEFMNWKEYAFYKTKEAVSNSYMVHAGAQYFPAQQRKNDVNRYWSFVNYRGGAYFGKDYIGTTKTKNVYGVTFGAGFPLTSFQRIRFGEFAVFNAGVEIGAKGNKNIGTTRESFVRFDFGFAMSAAWFQKRKYD